MGSKSKIAEDIVEFLPVANVLSTFSAGAGL